MDYFLYYFLVYTSVFLILSLVVKKYFIQLNIKTFITIYIISLISNKIINDQFYTNKEKIKKKKDLVVGISPDYPPFTYIEKDKIIGFDIDLLEVIAEKTNQSIKLVPMPFHSLLISLQMGSIDLVASGMTGTLEREKHVLISNPYFSNNLCAISLKKNKISSLEELEGKEIIINTGYSTGETYIKKMNLNNKIIRLTSFPDAIINLSSENTFITSKTSLLNFFDTPESEKFYSFNLPESDKIETVSFLINKNNRALLEKINTIIDILKEDKTLKKLIKKWDLL